MICVLGVSFCVFCDRARRPDDSKSADGVGL